jgi:hypothetical protein
VQFYETEAHLVGQVTAFIRAGLLVGDAVIVIAGARRREDLERHLRGEISSAATRHFRTDQYLALDAAETLAKFMVDGQPDEKRFTGFMGPVLRRAAESTTRRIRVFGEMVNILRGTETHEAAIRLEAFWNNLAGAHPISIFCGYAMSSFGRGADGQAFLRVCDAHSRISPAESYAPPANAHAHFRAIAVLQQKAHALEAELARRK